MLRMEAQQILLLTLIFLTNEPSYFYDILNFSYRSSLSIIRILLTYSCLKYKTVEAKCSYISLYYFYFFSSR